MNLVSENIRFMWILAGVPLGAGVKRHWGLSTTAIFGYLAGYVYMYLYLYSYHRETARQLRMYAQLTRCFSAVAELLVTFRGMNAR